MLNFLLILSDFLLFYVVVSYNVLLLWLLLLLRRFFTLSGFSFIFSFLLSFFSLLPCLSFLFLLGFCLFFFFFFHRFLIHFFFCRRFLSLLLFCGLSLSLSFSLSLNRLLLCHLGRDLFIIFFASFGTTAKDLLNVECGIDTWGGSSEHLLEEVVRFVWLMARNYLCRLNIDLFTDH